MDGRGEKRPREEESAWLNDDCLICKVVSAPYPILAPGCRHPYCNDCAMRKCTKECDLCKKPWKATYRSFVFPNGVVAVAPFVHDLSGLIRDCIHLYRSGSGDGNNGSKGTAKQLISANPDIRAFFRANGLVHVKTVAARVSKWTGHFGQNAHVIVREDGDVIVYNSADTSFDKESDNDFNAVYITKDDTYKLFYDLEKRSVYTRNSLTPMAFITHVHAAMQADADSARQ